METIQGKVDRILFSNEENGFKVLKIKMTKGPLLTITGEFGPEIIPGTIADFHGDYKVHPKYGSNFKISGYAISHNQEEINSIQLFLDKVALNIGPERAKAVVKHFGNDLIKILNEEPHRLEEVPGIGKISAESLQKAWLTNKDEWEKNRQQYSLRAFLNSMGIKERRVKKIIAHFGGNFDAEDKIRANPYLLTEIEGFGFSTADYVAKTLGIPQSDPLRLKSFILYSLNVLCPASGHLYLLTMDLMETINRYCKEMVTTFLGKVTLEMEDLTDPIKSLVSEKQIEEDGDALYSKPSHKFESRSAELLTNMLSKPTDLILNDRSSVDRHIEEFERDSGFTLSKEQRDALYFFVEKKVFIITGAPGTGKTTILKAVVSLIHKFHLNLTCMTPTGISAKKMSATIGYDASTIHRRLGFRGNEWMNNEGNKYETDVVIIDETSMVDQETFYRLLCALKDRVHLILVGDDNQLPSVGAGNVLRELINCGSVPVVKLEQIFRQNEASDIIKVAHKIKNGDTDLTLFKADPSADVFFYRETDLAKIEELVVKLAIKFKTETKNEKRKAFQIITPRNDGPLSVNHLNTVLQNVLNPSSIEPSEIKCLNFILRRGDRIIVKKNDYENNIFNGDIGKVVSIIGGYITIRIDDRDIQLTVDEIDEKIKLAYTISCHKCVTKDSLIFLDRGLVSAENTKEKNTTFTGVGSIKEKITGKYETRPLVEVCLETNYGYFLKTSADHPILISSDKDTLFKKMSELNKNDRICIHRKVVPGKTIRIKTKNIIIKNSKYNRKIYERTIINLPSRLTEELSWMLGALIGDGCYTDTIDGMVEFTCPDDQDVLSEMRRIWQKINLKVGERKRGGRICSVYTISKNFRDWLYNVGLKYEKAPTKSIPKMIFSATVKCRQAFIRGLFDTDGGVEKDRLLCRFTSSSEKLIAELQLIFLSLGIISYKRNQSNKHYKLCLSGIDAHLFKTKIGFVGIRKAAILNSHKKTIKTNTDTIPFGYDLSLKIVSCFKNQIQSQGKKGKGLYSNKKIAKALMQVLFKKSEMTYHLLNRVVELSKNQGMILPEICFEVLKNHYFFDHVKKIKVTEHLSPMIDFKVKNQHSFVANGFVCHNSQGQEYPYIILPFINQFGKMLLQRNLLYTAITRAKEKVIIIGHGSALERAINNSSVYRRNTRLGRRINTCLLMKKNTFSELPLEEPAISPPAQLNEEPSSYEDIKFSALDTIGR